MSSTKERKNHKKTQNFNDFLANLLIYVGIGLSLAGITIFFFTFFPVIKEEIKYQMITNPKNARKKAEIKPVNTEFGIVIPKIAANAKIIARVNPYQEEVYQKALTQGVAQAEGTALPNETGNIFLFAHSSGDWYTANRYNSVFYLLNKLDKNDEIDIYYQKQKYLYEVTDKKIVEANEINYLSKKDYKKTLTLMTCWPPGTTLKRLVIQGKYIK